MLWEEDAFGPELPLFPEVLSPPKDGVEPENPEDGNKERGHQDEGPIEHRLPLRIGMGSMGDELNEVGIGSWVALSTCLHQPRIRDEGFWIIRGQDTVKTVAIGTTRHQLG
jgi:hypothetical protein